MITIDQVQWEIIPGKLKLKVGGVIFSVSGNVRGWYNDTKGTASFQVELPEPSGTFIQYDDLTTEDLVGFIESALGDKLVKLKDQCLAEINAIADNDPYIEELEWSN